MFSRPSPIAPNEPCVLHHAKVLRDCLACHRGSRRQPGNGQAGAVREPRGEPQPRPVAQRGEHRRGGFELRGTARATTHSSRAS